MSTRPFRQLLTPGRLGSVAERQIDELAAEVLLKLAGGLIAPGRIGFQTMGDDRGHGRRDRGVGRARVGTRTSAVGDQRGQDVVQRAAADQERVAARQQFVEDDSE